MWTRSEIFQSEYEIVTFVGVEYFFDFFVTNTRQVIFLQSSVTEPQFGRLLRLCTRALYNISDSADTKCEKSTLLSAKKQVLTTRIISNLYALSVQKGAAKLGKQAAWNFNSS